MDIQESQNAKSSSALSRVLQRTYQISIGLIASFVTFFYRDTYQHDTVDIVRRIVRLDPNGRENRKRLCLLTKRFINSRSNETTYIQVAAAVLFTADTSALSWVNIEDAHWSATACLYSSIVIALVAIVLSAQQRRALHSLTDQMSENRTQAALRAQALLTRKATRGATPTEREESKSMLFALQCPMMLFMLSISTFLAGLWSIVFSAVARKSQFRAMHIKRAILFGAVNLLLVAIFEICSKVIHRLGKLQNDDTTEKHRLTLGV